MKKLKSTLCALFLITISVYCVLRTDLVVQGARDGLELCIEVVIPSIFPFLFLVSFMSSYYSEDFYVLRILAKITKIPQQAQHILISALFGGYPIGAQGVSTAYKSGQITKRSAERLLAFCNNAGPSFIFGFLGTLFVHKLAPLLLWIIHIISAVIVGIALPDDDNNISPLKKLNKENHELLKHALLSMATICGWVILFRVLIVLIKHQISSKLSPLSTALLCGVLELSNGCALLAEVNNESICFVATSVMLALGGACVFLQTKSATNELRLHKYLFGKILQSLLSFIFAIITCIFLY